MLAAPFARRSPTKKAESSLLPPPSVCFDDTEMISKVKPRESQANRQAISQQESPIQVVSSGVGVDVEHQHAHGKISASVAVEQLEKQSSSL